ncbi:C39 family peptidase [Lactiplantibacillus mudanjiangensis]|uniref:Peptidase C39-like domain-containing protein n=1 Tax=Lactiplantibacillus mudanjiangensis TaxID=1296538 RepID=A0A660E4X3_9LACO|nr:C39 family peptidase [Lactiplantibacillus mudanjiangensis]VDG23938.1 hypothetical protein [Lactobacillus brevis] [Lactiplantibacillus mudanjiangensis]VDG27118.1 hypothetical protein [Lactobacillus brevis] [Lactiplantibacillus mudanjiangensis]VDG33979.1 hypothetical protein [Lactobacillus brevis] [Lactiplantibacillus mudanjiangensis]
MKVTKLLLSLVAVVGGLLLSTTSQATTTHSARHYNSRTLQKNAQVKTTLTAKATKAKSSLVSKSYQLDRYATLNGQKYFQLSRRGKTIGWVNQNYLKRQSVYVLPYTYTSQLYPLYAPNACEAASLKMALSVKGLATKTSLKQLITKMPKSKSPKTGFFGNPYKDSPKNVIWTIYPKPLTKYAKTYDAKATNITGATKNQLIREVKRGNAVVFSGAWNMDSYRPYHVLALVGYKSGAFLVADPYMKKSWSNKVQWISTKKFMPVYQQRHSRALSIR